MPKSHGGPWSIVQMDCQKELSRQKLCEEFFQTDYLILRVTSLGIVSHGNIQVVLGSKVKGAAVMIGGCGQGVQLKDDSATAWHNHIAVGSEPSHTIVCGSPGNCIIEVNIMVQSKMGIEGNTQKPSLSHRVHGKGHKGSG